MRETIFSLLGLGTTPSCSKVIKNDTFRPGLRQINILSSYCITSEDIMMLLHRIYDTVITKEVFQDGWTKMKEWTSVGISRIHFGQMKACVQIDHLANFEASISNIAYTTGVSPLTWEKRVDVMIHKKLYKDLVTKLRTIVLTEANFNFNNKVLGRSTIYHAEKHQLLPEEQYGSRPNKCAIDHVLHKRLTHNILR